jgi:hypothetical protein
MRALDAAFHRVAWTPRVTTDIMSAIQGLVRATVRSLLAAESGLGPIPEGATIADMGTSAPPDATGCTCPKKWHDHDGVRERVIIKTDPACPRHGSNARPMTYEERLEAWKRQRPSGKVHCAGPRCGKDCYADSERCECSCETRCAPLNNWLDDKPQPEAKEGTSKVMAIVVTPMGEGGAERVAIRQDSADGPHTAILHLSPSNPQITWDSHALHIGHHVFIEKVTFTYSDLG